MDTSSAQSERVFELIPRASGVVEVASADLAQLSDDGRLQPVVGFFGETPASA